MAPVALVLSGVAIFFSAVLFDRSDQASRENCARIHGVVETLDGFLAGSRPRLIQLEREGTLTREQLTRSLRDNGAQRVKLRTVDCPARL
jgi:hypothetical protein